MVRQGKARQGPAGKARLGKARPGLAGPAWHGGARQGMVWQARHGKARRGLAGKAWQGAARQGCVGLGQFNIAKVLSNHEIIYRLRCEVGGLLGITFKGAIYEIYYGSNSLYYCVRKQR